VIPTRVGKIFTKKIWDYFYTSWDYSLKNAGIIPPCGEVIPTCVGETPKKKEVGISPTQVGIITPCVSE
jgi:hypothetical protein